MLIALRPRPEAEKPVPVVPLLMSTEMLSPEA